MKKWFILLLMVCMYTTSKFNIEANADYKNFESIRLKSGKFLKDYSKEDYNTYYKKVTKRKFYGWRSYEVHSDLKVTYKTETYFSYYNDGTTPIKYTYTMKRKQVDSMSLSSSGSIKVSLSGPIKKFKGGLDSQLKLDYQHKSSSELQEEFKVNVDVDPQTMMNLYVYGEGLISNGVAANYIFWIRSALGGYEVFTITTQYYRLEKVRI